MPYYSEKLSAERLQRCYDLVLGIQNSLSAFHVDAKALLRAAAGVAKPGGTLLFSSYAAGFWKDRLHWFRLQAAEGLLGEIDEAASGDGVIVCRDGFRATTFSPADFLALARDCGFEAKVATVAGSSLFCKMTVAARGGNASRTERFMGFGR